MIASPPAVPYLLAQAETSAKSPVVHITHTFRFSVPVSLANTAPLFGPEGERAWAGPSWQPSFVYPQPAADVQGVVFTTPHGSHVATWVNTIFDLANGRMQYVVCIPGTLVTVIDVRLSSQAAALTLVEVTYTRTALDPEANDQVLALGENDAASGPKWRESILSALQQKGLTPADAK